jgi:2,4-dienoyl-CoA reductase (NADPH2)
MSQESKNEGLVFHSPCGCLSKVDHDRNCPDFDLLSPIKIRDLRLHNRIVLSPMCQYSSHDGFANDWHLVHLGSRAIGGASLIFTEATSITSRGRISPYDLGIWDDKHIAFLARITHFVKQMGRASGIQLAHAGRKASSARPWEGGNPLTEAQGGWPLSAPSPIPFIDQGPIPQELDQKHIHGIIQAFVEAAKRALKAGFDIIEIHAAHGYLLHEFLSPLSNVRKDEYGGSLENRMRLICQVVDQLRGIMPASMPLFVRISATDWVEGGWDLQQSIILSAKLKDLGVDLIDVSTGALVPQAKIPVGPNYQVPFAAEIRKETGILTGTVGLITDAQQANSIITSGEADLVFIGREFLREPYWGLKAEQILNQKADWPAQYGYAVQRRR